MLQHEPSEFELGYKAGLRGEDPRTCPFEKMTKEWNRWQFAHNVGTKYRDHVTGEEP